MFNLVRKHTDPAVQAEFQNVYKLLNVLAGLANRQILTGSATYNGATGREVAIPYQETTDYFVSISPLVDEVAFDSKTEIVQGNDKFTVTSTLTSGTFL